MNLLNPVRDFFGSDQRSLRFLVDDKGFTFVDKQVNNPGLPNDGLALVSDGKKLLSLGNTSWAKLVSSGMISQYPIDDLFWNGKRYFPTTRDINKLASSADGKKWDIAPFTNDSEENDFKMTFYSVISISQ